MIVILGAGLTGLSLGYYLQKEKIDYKVFESDNKVGGLCKSIKLENGYVDYTGHFLHINKEEKEIYDLVHNDLLKDNYEKHIRKAKIFMQKKVIDYPFQLNFQQLNNKKLTLDCIEGLGNVNIKNEYLNFEDWVVSNLGYGIYHHFMKPYNEKLWATRPDKLTTEWLGEYLPKFNKRDILNKVMFDEQEKSVGYNNAFTYPKSGGIGELVKGYDKYNLNYSLNQEATKINLQKREVQFNKVLTVSFNELVSTIPLNRLLEIIEDKPAHIEELAQKLNYTKLLAVNLIIEKTDEDLFKTTHWFYLPEYKIVPYRMGVFSNINSLMGNNKYHTLYIERSFAKDDVFDVQVEERKVIDSLIEQGMIEEKNIVEVKTIVIDPAYVIYDENYTEVRSMILEFLRENNIISTGRYGDWKYSSMTECFTDAKKVVKELKEDK